MTTVHGTSADTVHRIRTLYNQRVTMRDGVELAADVYMPVDGGPFPALVLRTPYDKLASDDLQLRSAIVHPGPDRLRRRLAGRPGAVRVRRRILPLRPRGRRRPRHDRVDRTPALVQR